MIILKVDPTKDGESCNFCNRGSEVPVELRDKAYGGLYIIKREGPGIHLVVTICFHCITELIRKTQ